MAKTFHSRVLKYVRPDQPLGPADAHLIKDPEVAAFLFDPHNKSFNALLRKDVSVVVGRRGSGKTALLNSYLYRPYFSKGQISAAGDANLDISDYKVVISILNHKLFDHMQDYVVGPSGARRAIESVIEAWGDLITDYILASLLHEYSAEMDGERLSIISQYMCAPEIKKKSDAYRLVWGPNVWDALKSLLTGRKIDASPPSKEEAWSACLAHLTGAKAAAVVIFDSLDEYEIGDSKVDRTVGALLRFVSQFNSEHDRIKIKLGFPSYGLHPVPQ
ncbi:MAG: GTPase domain-containing protein, partial [Xanthobacteraceae bacterium]